MFAIDISPRIRAADGARDTDSELADSQIQLFMDKKGGVNGDSAGGIQIETTETAVLEAGKTYTGVVLLVVN